MSAAFLLQERSTRMSVVDHTMNYYYPRERLGGLRQQGSVKNARRRQEKDERPSSVYPIDPVELSHRLSIVLAEQNSAAERQRLAALRVAAKGAAAPTVITASSYATATAKSSGQRAATDRAAAEPQPLGLKKSRSILDRARRKPSKQSLAVDPAHNQQQEAQLGHPYVPREAASQFALTTTAISMREGYGASSLARKLSRTALGSHMNKGDADRISTDRTSDQVHRNRIIEEEVDDRAHRGHRPRRSLGNVLQSMPEMPEGYRRSHTYDEILDRATDDLDRQQSGPSDQGAQANHEDLTPPPTQHMPLQMAVANNHRVDWTQSDEARKPRITPFLRRPVSILTLGGRLGSKGREGKEPVLCDPIPDSLDVKSPKSGFFYAPPPELSPKLYNKLIELLSNHHQ